MASGFQNYPRTETQTPTGERVEWKVDFDAKTVTAVVAGVALGTFRNHTAAKLALGLVDVGTPVRRRAKEVRS